MERVKRSGVGGGEREEKTPARKHYEDEKHPLISRAWPLFRKWTNQHRRTIAPEAPFTSDKLDCEQSLFFFRFSKEECTRASVERRSRETRETRVAAREEKKSNPKKK